MKNADPKPEGHGERVPPPRAPVVATAEWPWPKRYAIAGWVGIIGYTDLEFPMVMGRWAAGALILTEAYREIRHVFELYRTIGRRQDGLRRFVQLRDQLGLSVSDGGTLPLAARVELIREWTPEKAYVHVSIRDRRYWDGRHTPLR